MRLVYTPHAERHLLSAIRWHNDQQARLGERFHSAVREREKLLKLFPEHGERYEGSPGPRNRCDPRGALKWSQTRPGGPVRSERRARWHDPHSISSGGAD